MRSQISSRLGSFCGRLAFIGNFPEGRLRVDLGSSGARMTSPTRQWLFHYNHDSLGSFATCIRLATNSRIWVRVQEFTVSLHKFLRERSRSERVTLIKQS